MNSEIKFHETTRHHGFKAVREIAVYQVGEDRPEKLGTIHCEECQFEARYQARLSAEELKVIAAKMEEISG